MSFKTVFMAVGAGQDDAEIDRAVAICERARRPPVAARRSASRRRRRPRPTASSRTTSGPATSARARTRPRPGPRRSRRGWPEPSSPRSVAAQYIDRGTVATLAARFARYADLTLVTPKAEGYESMQTWVMNGALFESGRPILLLPAGPVELPGGRSG